MSTSEDLWSKIRTTKAKHTDFKKTLCLTLDEMDREKLLNELEKSLDIQKNEEAKEDITNQKLKDVGEMFTYMITCPDKQTVSFMAYFKEMIESSTPKAVLQTLNRLAIKGWNTKALQKLILTVSKKMNFSFENIDMFTGKHTCKGCGKFKEEILTSDLAKKVLLLLYILSFKLFC